MANYNVQITNGSGSQIMQSGNYSVGVVASGYEANTLSPTSYTVTGSAGTGNFTVSACVVLTIVFNETGAAGGAPITSGSVVMTDSTGQIEYGSPVSINANGEAVFDKVPFDMENPYHLYFKQLASDGNHAPYPEVFDVGMGLENQTEYVLNAPICEQNFTLTDENYGFPVADAILSFVGE